LAKAGDIADRIRLGGRHVVLPSGDLYEGAQRLGRLTRTEVALLRFLASHPGRLFSQKDLLAEVWGYSPRVRSRTVISTVHRLRGKIEDDPKAPRFVVSSGGSYGFTREEARLDSVPVWAAGIGPFAGGEARRSLVQVGPGQITGLVGLGGVGKSRLALELARTGSWPGGVTFVELSDEGDVSHQLLARIGTEDPARCAAVLASRGTNLVVLDGCDVDRDGVRDLLHAVVPGSGHTHWLLTSRRPVGVAGEVRVAVPGLEIDAAVALLRNRAPAWRDVPDPELMQLAKRLEGHPQGLLLATARANILGPREVVERLEDGTQGGLEAIFAEAWGHLEGAERRVLEGLAGAPVPLSVAAVAAASGVDEGAVLDALVRLAEQSLVVSERLETGVTRVRCAAVVARQVANRSDRDVWPQLVSHATDVARRFALGVDMSAVPELAFDLRFYREALRHAARAGDPESVAWLAVVVATHEHATGADRDSAGVLAQALESPLAPATEICVRIARSRLSANRGLSPFEDLDRALALAEEVGDATLELKVRLYRHGDRAFRLDEAQRARSLARELGHPAAEAIVERILGNHALRSGRVADAAEHYRRSIDLAAAHGQHTSALWSRSNLAVVHGVSGDLARSERELWAIFEDADALGLGGPFCSAGANLAEVLKLRGDLEQAAEVCERTLQVLRARGAASDEASLVLARAMVDMDRGREEEARRDLGRLLRYRPELPAAGRATSVCALVGIALLAGRQPTAQALLDEAEPDADALSRAVLGMARAWTVLVDGDRAHAASLLEKSAEVLSSRGLEPTATLARAFRQIACEVRDADDPLLRSLADGEAPHRDLAAAIVTGVAPDGAGFDARLAAFLVSCQRM